MEVKDNHVTVAIDLSRAFKGTRNIIINSELYNIISLGREIDLLETIRRQDNPNKDIFTTNKKEVELHAAYIGIDPVLLETFTLKKFINNELIELKDNNRIEIKITQSQQVYDFAKKQIRDKFNDKDKAFLNLVANGMIKPVVEDVFNNTISKFPDYAQKPLKSYLNQTKILSPIQANASIFYASPKIYKNKVTFCRLMEDNSNTAISTALEFISENPGIPMDSLTTTSLSPTLIKGLSIAGAIDSVTLNIDGTSRKYIVPSNLSNARYDNDHLDQVKKTLANFRFGERYSKWTLSDLQTFLESMVNRGYAGRATPIGTDYKNLEIAGIVKVAKVVGEKYRFWMLKKDVIEDTIKVLRGAVPLVENNPSIKLYDMENSVMSRIIMSNSISDDDQQVADAIRKISGGLF